MAKHRIISECREGGKVHKVGDIVDIDTALPGGMDRLHSLASNGRIEPLKDDTHAVPTAHGPGRPMSTSSSKVG